MARDSSFTQGSYPNDPDTGKPIKQSLAYSLTTGNIAVPVSSINPMPMQLVDILGNPITTSSDAGGNVSLNIHDVDINSILVNSEMHQHSATSTTLAAATSGDGTVNAITVASAAGFVVGNAIHVDTTSAETTHPIIVDVTGSVLTLDRYLDNAHEIGDVITKAVLDMSSQVGSLAVPHEYWVGPPAGQVWHITRFIFEMTHPAAGDLGTFGDLAALTNGIIIRSKLNGQYRTLTNWKNNGDIKLDVFDVEFDARSGGGGAYSTGGRGSFKEIGGVVRLDGDTNDRIELYVQDDITALNLFKMKAQGHVEVA